ncbi:hypothetical protein LCGC14_1318010 [marine sediment metagenome]|uniref:Thymidylate synthase (FAD) n=1 Tax=marine sediment metagenome TaxID=412755 RepID=A0A0F9KKV8_9ZZZZ
MEHVTPMVFLIGSTQVDFAETRAWLDFLGADQYKLPTDDKIQMGALLVQLCAKRCYKSYQVGLNPNITKVRDDMTAFIDNILKVGHGSVLEHVSFSFALENVSRVFTAEMNRHRAGMAISEGSMRYISFEDIPYWVPTSIRADSSDSPQVRLAKKLSRDVFDRAFQQAEENYRELMTIWNYDEAITKFSQKKQLTSMFRRIIPQGVATGGVWTGNLRALRHIFQLRCSQYAEEEICLVASLMLTRMIESESVIFKDFYLEDGYWKSKYNKV